MPCSDDNDVEFFCVQDKYVLESGISKIQGLSILDLTSQQLSDLDLVCLCSHAERIRQKVHPNE